MALGDAIFGVYTDHRLRGRGRADAQLGRFTLFRTCCNFILALGIARLYLNSRVLLLEATGFLTEHTRSFN